ALLFAAHPVHVEAVANVVGRAELLAAIGFLAGFLAYVRAVDAERTRWNWLAGSVAIMIAGSLCKESCVTLAAVLFVYDWLRSAGPGLAPRPWRPFMERQAAVLAGALAFLWFRGWIAAGLDAKFTAADNPVAFASWPEKVYLIALAHTQSARVLLWPATLSVDYSVGSFEPIRSLSSLHNVAAMLVYAGLAAAVIFAARKGSQKGLLFALAGMVITYLPVSHLLLNVGLFVAERTMYLPSVW